MILDFNLLPEEIINLPDGQAIMVRISSQNNLGKGSYIIVNGAKRKILNLEVREQGGSFKHLCLLLGNN